VGGVDLALGPSSPEVTTEDDGYIVLEGTGRKANELDEAASRGYKVGSTSNGGNVLLFPIAKESIGGDEERGVADRGGMEDERDTAAADERLSDLSVGEVDDFITN
jgi:hypothetical protein